MADRRKQAVSVVAVVVVWQLATGVFEVVSSAVLPSPVEITIALGALLFDTRFLGHVGTTLWRTAVAAAIAVPAGIAVGVAMGWNDRVHRGVSPLLYALYPMPVVALLPLILVIFGSGDRALIFVAALGGFFLLVWNAAAAVENVDPVYFEVARDNGATSTTTLFREVLLPGSLSLLFTGFRVCLSTALLVVIATEFIAANSGLGFFLWQSWRSYLLADLYAAVLVIGLFGIAITYGLGVLYKRLVPWETELDGPVFV